MEKLVALFLYQGVMVWLFSRGTEVVVVLWADSSCVAVVPSEFLVLLIVAFLKNALKVPLQ